LVNAVLSKNPEPVSLVAAGDERRITLNARFGAITGTEAYLRTLHSQPIIRATFGVRVVLIHDPRAEKGFRVQSAFPVR
jgi:hypothetical protein